RLARTVRVLVGNHEIVVRAARGERRRRIEAVVARVITEYLQRGRAIRIGPTTEGDAVQSHLQAADVADRRAVEHAFQGAGDLLAVGEGVGKIKRGGTGRGAGTEGRGDDSRLDERLHCRKPLLLYT